MLHRHALTSGEVADYYYKTSNYSFPLYIEKAKGWERDSYFDEYDYPWIPTSPNMPTISTAVIYPGACLLEGTNLSEGRGTTFPFLSLGTPNVDSFKLKDLLDKEKCDGLTLIPLEFRPMFQKEEMQTCGGIYIYINDRYTLQPFRAFIKIINLMRKVSLKDNFFRTKAYEFVDNIPAIELLLGLTV